MESHAPVVGAGRMHPPRLRRRPAEAKDAPKPGWGAPFALIVMVAMVAAVACALSLTWLAVVLATSPDGGDGTLPWAIGCAAAAVISFMASLGALVGPRSRHHFLYVAIAALVLLATTGLAMSIAA